MTQSYIRTCLLCIPFFLLCTTSLLVAQNQGTNSSDHLIQLNKEATYADEPAVWRSLIAAPAEDSYQLLYEKTDNAGNSHKRFTQYNQGIKVQFGEVITHSKGGLLYAITNDRKVIPSKLAALPTTDETAALQTCLAHVNAQLYKWQIEADEAQLRAETKDANATAYPKGILVWMQTSPESEMSLAWKFDVYAIEPLSRKNYYVDAHSGKILLEDAILKHANEPGTAGTRYSGTQNIITDKVNATQWRLRETGRAGGVSINTLNALTGTSTGAAVEFTDNDNNWGLAEHAANFDNAAHDAHWGIEKTVDYFWNVHGRNSVDNAGFALNSYVHWSVAYDNAFWNGSAMFFGDGGTSFTPLTALDVTAHELGHGVTQYTSNLVYEREWGALNESLSDIWGAAVENNAAPTKQPLLIGEEISIGSYALRDMANPKGRNDPDTYLGQFWSSTTPAVCDDSNDQCGVHTNSGVQNYWFALLAAGGTGTNDNGYAYNIAPLGWNAAEKIVYHGNDAYYGNMESYPQARIDMIQAAVDLFGVGSVQAQRVSQAWCAVGVGDRQLLCGAPNIAAAKSVLSYNPIAASGIAGNVEVEFSIKITNNGLFDLGRLSLSDNMAQLGCAFVGILAQPTITASTASTNPGFQAGYGLGQANIFNGTSGLLKPGESITIKFKAELNPNCIGVPTPLANQATAGGTVVDFLGNPTTDPTTGLPLVVTDLSDGGTDPLSANLGFPGNSGGMNDPLELRLPVLSVSKGQLFVEAAGPLEPEGHVRTTFIVKVRNTGNTPLIDVGLDDNLTAQLGCVFQGVTPASIAITTFGLVPVAPVLGAYNGGTNSTIFSGAVLDLGAEVEVRFTILTDPNCVGGSLSPLNQAIGRAAAISPVTQLLAPFSFGSDAGIVPESQNIGQPGDTGGSHDPTLVHLPSIVIVKDVIDVQNATSCIVGNTDVKFRIKVKNVGNTALRELSLLDFNPTTDPAYVRIVTAPTLVSSIATTTPALGNLPVIIGSGGLLNSGQEFTFDFTAEIDPNFSLNQVNSATVSAVALRKDLPNAALFYATGVAGLAADDSDSGDQFESFNIGQPGDTGSNEDPTKIQIPQLHISKRVIACVKEPLQAPIPGNAWVTLEFKVKNTGNQDLTNLQISDNLIAQLGGAFLGVVTPLQLISSTATTNPTLNPSFNGAGNFNLFNGTTGLLKQNQVLSYQMRILMDPDAPGAIVPAYNQATASGRGLNYDNVLITVSDLSDHGDTPESNNATYPNNNVSLCAEDDPTPIDVPMVLTTKEYIESICSYTDVCSQDVYVTFQNKMVNAGNVRLDKLSVEDDFAAQLGAGFVSTIAPYVYIMPGTNASTSPTVNPTWNGDSDPFIFKNTGILDVGQQVIYTYRAFLNPSAPSAPFPLVNQTLTDGRGIRVTGMPVLLADLATEKHTVDLSDAGDKPLTTNPGFAGDTGGSDDITEFCLPRITKQPADITLNACDGVVNVTTQWKANHAGAQVQTCSPIICWLNDELERIPTGCGGNYKQKVKFTVKDSDGGTICFCAWYHVVDNTGPIWDMEPMNKTVNCSDPTATQQVQSWLEDKGGGWVYDCGGAYFMEHTPVPAVLKCGSTTVVFKATDECNYSTTRSAVLTVIDNTPPVFANVPANTTITCPAVPSFGTPTVSDLCGTVTLTQSNQVSGGPCPAASTVTRTWTATDACGNTATTSATITVLPPQTQVSIACPANITVSTAAGVNSAVVTYTTPTASTSCTIGSASVSLASGLASGSTFLVGTTQVCYAASDACGNSTSCCFTVTVNFTPPPPAQVSIVCPSNISVSAAAGVNSAVVTYSSPTASTTCTTGSASVSLTSGLASGSSFPAGSTQVCYTATDACGNSTSCCFTVTVNFTPPPPTQVSIVCPVNITVSSAAGVNSAVVTYNAPTVNTTCTTGSASISLTSGLTSGSTFPVGTTQVCYAATDACGNSTSCCFAVTVQPTTSNLIVTPPPNQNLACGSTAIFGTASATTTCSMSSNVQIANVDLVTGSACAGFTHTRTFIATDLCGNSASATQIILVAADNTAPTFTFVPTNATLDCGSTITFGAATATDVCSGSATVTHADMPKTGSCSAGYTYQRIFTATDACGNTATATQTIQTNPDTEPPVFTSLPPQDLMINCGTPINFGQATAIDYCSDPVTVTMTVTNNGVDTCNTVNGIQYGYDLYVHWKATDACGNMALANTNIWVLPTTNIAFLSKPADLTVSCKGTWDWQQPMPKSYMAPIVSTTFEDVSNLNACGAGTITRIWTATDALGHTCQAEQTVLLIEDQIVPQITIAQAVHQIECGTVPSFDAPLLSDNCTANADLVLTFTDQNGTNKVTRTWTVSDACGNASTAKETINIRDTKPPVLASTLTNKQVSCGESFDFSAQPLFTDVCSDQLDISFVDNVVQGTCVTSYTRTWTAQDVSGNAVTVAQTVEEKDATAPIFNQIPLDFSVICSDNVVFDDITATDACQPINTVYHLDKSSVPSCGNTGITHTRTWTANDGCNNLTAIAQNIYVAEDVQAPVFVGSDLYMELTEAEFNALVPSILVSDNCQTPNVTHSDPLQVDHCNYTLDWLASDDCGNYSTASQSIHITDGSCAPVSVHDPLLEHLFVYPNPFDSKLMLEWQGAGKGIDYRIYDILGRLIMQGQLSVGKNEIDTATLYSGTYFIQINDSEFRSGLYKIVKTRL